MTFIYFRAFTFYEIGTDNFAQDKQAENGKRRNPDPYFFSDCGGKEFVNWAPKCSKYEIPRCTRTWGQHSAYICIQLEIPFSRSDRNMKNANCSQISRSLLCFINNNLLSPESRALQAKTRNANRRFPIENSNLLDTNVTSSIFNFYFKRTSHYVSSITHEDVAIGKRNDF